MKRIFHKLFSIGLILCPILTSVNGSVNANAASFSATSATQTNPIAVPFSRMSSPTVSTSTSSQKLQQLPPQTETGQEEATTAKSTFAETKTAGGRELSPIEKALSGAQLATGKPRPQPFAAETLVQFGYDFFRPEAKGFAPSVDIPVGPDYVVSAGDRLILTLWGSVEGTYELEINRAGEIILPMVGPVKVAGLAYGQLPSLIKANLARELKNFQLSINMGKLRMIKVYVVGHVLAPGDYNISSLSTLLNALAAAGGPTREGSLRAIQIKRNGKLVEIVDLYDFFLKGDKSRDIHLQPGDTVFVPAIGPVAGIAGNVRLPAIFELKDEKTLKELLLLADGIKSTGYLQRVQLKRVEAHKEITVADFNLDTKETGKTLDELEASIPIKDLDVVKIFPIDATLRWYVRLEGYVLRPGEYALKPGMRLSQLLVRENILPEYYENIGEITRLCPPDLHPEKILFNPAKAMSGDSRYDLELKEFDTVHIFSRWEMEEMPKVIVRGEVQKAGEYRLFENMTVRDLLVAAGNTRLSAYLKNADLNRISKTNDNVTSYTITVNLEEALAGNPKYNIPLAPYDELIVRAIPNWAEETDRNVTLNGEFRFPGTYAVHKGERLSSVIERAGGFTDKAYLKAARFTRKSVQELQQKRMDELIATSEKDVLKKQAELASTASSKEELDATKSALEGLQRSVQLLKTARAEGRMVIRLKPVDKLKGTASNVELQGGDVLIVPEMPSTVNVLGQVYNPASIIPVDNGDVAYYLEKAGGPTRDAETDDMYVVKTDGTVMNRQQVSSFKSLFFAGFMSTDLEPGDTLIVPQRLEKIAWVRDIKDITQILANIALTAGIMVAAGL
jgi:protein involved in polysaccharide export with SLBB domain